jgi:hypothetical protein
MSRLNKMLEKKKNKLIKVEKRSIIYLIQFNKLKHLRNLNLRIRIWILLNNKYNWIKYKIKIKSII